MTTSRTGLRLGTLWTAGAAALLAGCVQQQAPAPRSTTPIFAADLKGGAKTCTAPSVTPAAGKEVPATMSVENDGGWCGLTVAQDGKPYDAGLLTARPAHGKVFVHTVGDNTRIDYTPAAGTTGPDTFSVTLLPGNAVVKVAVTVTPGPASAAPTPPPPAEKPATPSRRRSSTHH